MKNSTKEGLDAWAQHAIPPGDFLQAVLRNDLMEAFARADMENTVAMQEIVGYVYNHLPAACWGSKEKMGKWAAIVAQTEAAQHGG